jgi:hydroxymethylpyrimidine pyrophosphatase-like HAD family hydrolase
MRIEAVITDLDGTFWAADMSVHAETHGAVAQIDAAGIPFVIATGRRARGALHGLAAAGYHDRPGILMNGALVRDRLDGPSFVVEKISGADALAIIAAFDDHGLEPIAYVDDDEHDMLVGGRPAAGTHYVSTAPGIRRVSDLAAEMDRHPVIGFGAFGYERGHLAPIADAINESGWATAILGRSLFEGGHSLMVQASGIDKQTGIEAWCDRNGIDASRVAVLGDAGNDELMLRAAAVAIVPTDAPPEIRELADHVIEPADRGGWRDLPRILGLEKD